MTTVKPAALCSGTCTIADYLNHREILYCWSNKREN